MLRHPTNPVAVGGAPITVQSMTITKTADVEGTLQQIYALYGAGADIVRCTCNEREAAEGLAQIIPRSPVPIVADIHHQYKRALDALERRGALPCGSTPATSATPSSIQDGGPGVQALTDGVPIRIGVNGGSLDKSLYEKYGGKVTAEAMVESAEIEMAYFDEIGFEDIKISVKASSVPLMIEAYRQPGRRHRSPVAPRRHRGRARTRPGSAKATAGMATLLARGNRRHTALLAHRRPG